LIEKAELDITKLALALVTDQFLDFIHGMPESSVADVSSFLVIASKLVQIKSEALLPRPPIRGPGEIDPGEDLARQLRLYKKFKEIANFLASRTEGLRTHPRLAPAPHIEPTLDISGLTVEDLFLAAQYILSRNQALPTLDSVVSLPRITIREKILHIAQFLRKQPRGTFHQLLSSKTRRLEVVITFLALLELVKMRLIMVEQDNLFGEISLEPVESWDENMSFDLEFGE
jgi:segregation and condensation protein A